MANIISAKKRARQTAIKTAHNRFHLVRMRTAVKKLMSEKDAIVQKKLFEIAQSYIARTAKKNIISKKTAQRLTSRLAARIKPKST
ncbi:MAG: 30S ribosomal protein S20 [Alphaproteobacteria bacterium]|nr:30S ribosomal protein S20 [Alphaproteobacteria bacterium]